MDSALPTLISTGVVRGSSQYWLDALSRIDRIHVPLQGVAEYRDFHGTLLLEPGFAYLMPNGYAKDLALLPGKEYQHLYFDFRCTPPLPSRAPLKIPRESDPVLFALFDAAAALICNGASPEEQNRFVLPKDPAFGEIEALIRATCSYLFRSYGVSAVKEPKVALALDYIREHYSESIGNAEIAEALHVDNRYLIRLFRRYLSVTPYQYLTQYRIERGRELLRRGKTVGEAAYACGYQSEAAFRIAYKRITGESPTASRHR